MRVFNWWFKSTYLLGLIMLFLFSSFTQASGKDHTDSLDSEPQAIGHVSNGSGNVETDINTVEFQGTLKTRFQNDQIIPGSREVITIAVALCDGGNLASNTVFVLTPVSGQSPSIAGGLGALPCVQDDGTDGLATGLIGATVRFRGSSARYLETVRMYADLDFDGVLFETGEFVGQAVPIFNQPANESTAQFGQGSILTGGGRLVAVTNGSQQPLLLIFTADVDDSASGGNVDVALGLQTGDDTAQGPNGTCFRNLGMNCGSNLKSAGPERQSFIISGSGSGTPEPRSEEVKFRGTVTDVFKPIDFNSVTVQVEEVISGPVSVGQQLEVVTLGGLGGCSSGQIDEVQQGDRVEVFGQLSTSLGGDMEACSSSNYYVRKKSTPAQEVKFRGEVLDVSLSALSKSLSVEIDEVISGPLNVGQRVAIWAFDQQMPCTSGQIDNFQVGDRVEVFGRMFTESAELDVETCSISSYYVKFIGSNDWPNLFRDAPAILDRNGNVTSGLPEWGCSKTSSSPLTIKCQGSIQPGTDNDWMKIALKKGQKIALTLQPANTLDTELVFDPWEHFSANPGKGAQESLEVEVNEDRDYEIGVQHCATCSTETGDWTLIIKIEEGGGNRKVNVQGKVLMRTFFSFLKITLIAEGGEYQASTFLDKDGKFTFKNVPANVGSRLRFILHSIAGTPATSTSRSRILGNIHSTTNPEPYKATAQMTVGTEDLQRGTINADFLNWSTGALTTDQWESINSISDGLKSVVDWLEDNSALSLGPAKILYPVTFSRKKVLGKYDLVNDVIELADKGDIKSTTIHEYAHRIMYKLNHNKTYSVECAPWEEVHVFGVCYEQAYSEGWAHFVEFLVYGMSPDFIGSVCLHSNKNQSCSSAVGPEYEHRVVWAFNYLWNSGWQFQIFDVMGYEYKDVPGENDFAETMLEFYDAWMAKYGSVPDSVTKVFQIHFGYPAAERTPIFPSPPPAEGSFAALQEFDLNDDGKIGDPEFFNIIDAWIKMQMEDETFFLAIDLWISGETISSARLSVTTHTKSLYLRRVLVLQKSDTVQFRAEGIGIETMRVEIFSSNGERIFTGEVAGQRVIWNLRSKEGRSVANGVYLYRIIIQGPDSDTHISKMRKLLIMR